MYVPCELAVKSIMPAFRALVAEKLLETYGLKQGEAAQLLGITQSAISRYVKNERGNILKSKIAQLEDVNTLMMEVAEKLIDGKTELHEISRTFCRGCQRVRAMGLLCETCRRFNPKLDENCDLCTGGRSHTGSEAMRGCYGSNSLAGEP